MSPSNIKTTLVKRRNFLALMTGAVASILMPAWSFAKRFWPVRTVEPAIPQFDPAKWRLTVDGLVENKMSITFEEVKALPFLKQTTDLDCVERWSVTKINWQGVQLKTIIEIVKPKPEAKFLTIYCSGGTYSESLSLDQAHANNVILAYIADGKLLEPKHGGPLRLVVPSLWAYKSAKWVERIEFVESQHLGYWELRGYDPDAGPATQSEKIKNHNAKSEIADS